MAQRFARRQVLGAGVSSMVAVLVAACGGAPAGSATAPPAKGEAKAPSAPAATAPAAQPTAQAAPKAGSVTIQAALGGSQQAAQRKKALVKKFEDQNPGITVDWAGFDTSDHDQFYTKLLTEFAAGKTRDLIAVVTEGLQLFGGKNLGLPLDDYVKRDRDFLQEYFSDVTPSLVEAMMYEGGLYALPDNCNAANMFYNVEVFTKLGITPPGPDWTVQDFLTVSRKVAEKKDASGQPETFAYAWVNRHWGGFIPWLFVNNTNLLTEERAPGGEWMWNTFYANDAKAKGRGGGWRWNASKANDPAVVEALQMIVDITRKDRLALEPVQGGGSELQGFFTQGKIAMTPAGGFWAGGLKNAGMPPGTFEVQFFPKWKSQRHQFGTGGHTILKDSKLREESWKLLKHMATKEYHVDNYAGAVTTPVRRSLANADLYKETGMKSWSVFYDTFDKFPDTAPIPAPPESNQMVAIFTKYIGVAMAGEMPPKGALDKMHEELTKLLEQRPKR